MKRNGEMKDWSNGLKKMALGWVLQSQLLGTDAACKPGRSLAKLDHSQHREVLAILFLAQAIKIVYVIPIVLQAISYFICELLKF